MGSDTSKESTQIESPNMSSKDIIRSLQFHEINGKNIILKRNKTVARRSDGFNNGIIFTSRPVLILESIVIQINETATNWSGALRIGFTLHDPKYLRSKIPAHSCPDLVSIPGNWAKALPEAVNSKDNLISFHVDANGDVYYGIDDEEKKFLLSGVNTSYKLWGIVDVYGNTVEVELLGPHLVNHEDEEQLLFSKIAFHKNHGKTLSLQANGQVAVRDKQITYYSYVFCSRPLKFDEKVIIQVLKIDHFITGPIEYGVTSCNPSVISADNLPADTDELLDQPDYWVVHQDNSNYSVDDIIMFNISAEGKFLVLKNGTSRSTILHVDTSQPLWLFFKLSGSISGIFLKGTSTDDYADIMREFQSSDDTLSDNESNEVDNSSAAKVIDEVQSSNEKSTSECVICCDKQVDCALYRCGHMCMCYQCAQELWQPNKIAECPICRQLIQDIIKVYAT